MDYTITYPDRETTIFTLTFDSHNICTAEDLQKAVQVLIGNTVSALVTDDEIEQALEIARLCFVDGASGPSA